jgi:hypothetical protein
VRPGIADVSRVILLVAILSLIFTLPPSQVHRYSRPANHIQRIARMADHGRVVENQDSDEEWEPDTSLSASASADSAYRSASHSAALYCPRNSNPADQLRMICRYNC